MEPLLKKMAAFPAPTFAAAHGGLPGGVGLGGLLLATDVVYVADNAKFGSPFAKLGATLDSGGHWYFTERLGMHRTLDLIYTADLISGAEAVEQGGMFSRAMPADSLLPVTREIVSRVATGGRQVRSTRPRNSWPTSETSAWACGHPWPRKTQSRHGFARPTTTPRVSVPSRRSGRRFSRARFLARNGSRPCSHPSPLYGEGCEQRQVS